jgi:Glycosyl transferase family 11
MVGRTLIYPRFGGHVDTGFVRLSGDGLGNSFYTYFHAVVMARESGAALIYPTWRALRIGPLLRGERSTRTYWNTFRPHADEIRGPRKMLALMTGKRNLVEVGSTGRESVRPGLLNVVKSRDFTFQQLHDFLPLIRDRLIAIINDRIPPEHSWGKAGYIAVHVRLGDFAAPTDDQALLGGKANLRIPLSWYVAVVRELRARYPDRQVFIFSDGNESELAPLLELGGRMYRSGSDIKDLLAMAAASLFVGSNSTYSRWAAFLGDMPSIWVKKRVEEEKPSAPDTPILFVPIDGSGTQDIGRFADRA